jgi:hypothetical protein
MHRHTFEVTKVGDKPTSGVMKDTISMGRYSTAEIDFVADDPGNTLFHCHHQDHMDEGFAGLITSWDFPANSEFNRDFSPVCGLYGIEIGNFSRGLRRLPRKTSESEQGISNTGTGIVASVTGTCEQLSRDR